MGKQGFYLSLHVHERNKAVFFLSPSKQHTCVPASTCLIGKPVKGYKVFGP